MLNSSRYSTSSHWRLFLFFFNDTATTEIYTLSLHDALPISRKSSRPPPSARNCASAGRCAQARLRPDRKSTRLNSSHTVISYAVFCLKKKKQQISSKLRHQKRLDYSIGTLPMSMRAEPCSIW